MTEGLEYNNLTAMLEEYGRQIVAAYRAKLDADGRNASGKLRDTLESFVKRDGDVFSVWLKLQDYWKYLERGTRWQGPYAEQGKFPPLAPFVSWVQKKGIPLQGRSVEQVARGVAFNVWRFGTPPHWYLRDTLAEAQDITERCREAIIQDIQDWLQAIIDKEEIWRK